MITVQCSEISCIFYASSKRSLLSILTALVDGLDIVVIVVDGITFCVFHDQFELLQSAIVPGLERILDQRNTKARDDILGAFVLRISRNLVQI